ncbi:hypothetical protein LA080_007264 [Diaporthe eres]|nr:hypothetical protein LA080_007264 [Diaporthe eres]
MSQPESILKYGNPGRMLERPRRQLISEEVEAPLEGGGGGSGSDLGGEGLAPLGEGGNSPEEGACGGEGAVGAGEGEAARGSGGGGRGGAGPANFHDQPCPTQSVIWRGIVSEELPEHMEIFDRNRGFPVPDDKKLRGLRTHIAAAAAAAAGAGGAGGGGDDE